jgi:hypothetical protein
MPKAMPGRDEKIYAEAVALWRQLYGEAPPRGMDARRMLDRIMICLPEPRYAQFASRHLRPTNITFPRPNSD